MNKQEMAVPFLEIVYNGKTYNLTKEDAVNLAQKGMNYDKVAEKCEKLSEEAKDLKEKNDKITKLAENLRLSPDDLINGLCEEQERENISQYSKDNNIPFEYAKKLKEMELQIKSLQKEKEELIPIKRRNEEIKEFKKLYPDVDERNLDPEILKEWEETKRPLKDIYNEITLRNILNKKNIEKANEENKNASSGSVLGVPEREEEFTDEMIRNMSDKEFNKNFARILKQYKKGEK